MLKPGYGPALGPQGYAYDIQNIFSICLFEAMVGRFIQAFLRLKLRSNRNAMKRAKHQTVKINCIIIKNKMRKTVRISEVCKFL